MNLNDLYRKPNLTEGEQNYGPEWDEKVRRLGQMAAQGPRKTVWDPVKRVYKTVPVNAPKKDQGVAEGADDKFSVYDKVEELVNQYKLFDKRGWTDLFSRLAGRKLEVAEIRREMEYASKFLQLLDSIRMRSDYRGQQDPKEDQELIDLSNQWLSLFNKATGEFKGMSSQGVAEGMPADNDMGSTTGGAKMTLGQWKQMWMKKMPNADFAAMFRSPPNMRGSAIAYFDGWVNNPDARWDPQQGVAEAGFPGAPDVEMPPMKPSGDPQRDKLKQQYMDIHHEIKSLVDIPYSSDS
jgi:hypothetical protein